MLLMRVKEEKDYYGAKDNYQKIQEIIESGKRFEYHDDKSPRIVPKGITPAVVKEIIDIPVENTQADATNVEPKRTEPKPKKKPAKKFHMPDGVETGFQFLGSKKRDKVVSKKSTKRLLLDRDEAIVPLDGNVLLTSEQEIELEERFASISGEEPQYIQLVEPGKRPEKLRTRTKTHVVTHSATTKLIIRAISLAKSSPQYTNRPSRPLEEEEEEGQGLAEPEKNSDASDMGELFEDHEEPFYVARNDNAHEPSQQSALDELEKILNIEPRKAPSKKSSRRGRARAIISDDEDDS